MDRRISRWSLGAFGLIAIFTILLIIKWKSFPIFLDLYYHATCMMGFEKAGGISLYDFWEYAPVGRPHLYPPLLHILMLGFYKIGLSSLSIMRLISISIYPLVLITIWWVLERLYSRSVAFFTVAIATIPYTFFLSTVNAVPASLALMIIILLFYAVEKGKILSSILLLGLSFYAHGALPWVAIPVTVLYGLVSKKNLKFIFIIVLGGMILGSPWLIHMLQNKEYFLLAPTKENLYFEGNLLVYIFAGVGGLIALKRKGRYYFPIILLAAMAPIAITYKYRFLCGQGLLPVIFLAGIALDRFYYGAKAFFEKRMIRRFAEFISCYCPDCFFSF